MLLLFQWKKYDDECSGRQYWENNEQVLFTTVHSQLLFEQVSLMEGDHSLLLTSSSHCHSGQKCDAIGYSQNLSFSHHEVVALLINLLHFQEY